MSWERLAWRFAAMFSLAATLAACGGGGGDGGVATPVTPASTTGVAATLQLVAGNAQAAVIRTALPLALEGKVLDAAGAPVAGQLVNFIVVSGGGSVFAGAALSAADGTVRERWTLGASTGTQQVQVRCIDSRGAAVLLGTFSAVAKPGAAASIAVAAGADQSAPQLQAVAQSPAFTVRDAEGNPRPDTLVRFLTDNGSVPSPASATTDALGQVSIGWTMGVVFGQTTLTAQVDGVPEVSIRATVLQAPSTGSAKSVVILSGDGQSLAQHALLATPLRIAVLDGLGLRVVGATVSFKPAAGSAASTTTTEVSNAQGEVYWRGWYHGTDSQRTEVAVAGATSAFAAVTVTPTAYPMDGIYKCAMPSTGAPVGDEWTVKAGAFENAYLGSLVSSIDPTNGTVDLLYRSRLGELQRHFTGTLAVDAQGNATIVGTAFSYTSRFGSFGIVVTEVSDGAFSCTRR